MLIPPTHAFETHHLPEFLNRAAYMVKGRVQQMVGRRAGLPPVAVDGPIQLLPRGMSLTPGEVNSMRAHISGAMNSKGVANAKLAVLGGLGAAYYIIIKEMYLDDDEEERRRQPADPGDTQQP